MQYFKFMCVLTMLIWKSGVEFSTCNFMMVLKKFWILGHFGLQMFNLHIRIKVSEEMLKMFL